MPGVAQLGEVGPEITDLRRRVTDLEAQVAELRAENRQLREERVGGLIAPVPAPADG